MRIRAAIFDLDGTLLDTMRAWNELDERFLRSMGCVPKPGLQEAVMALTLRQSASYFRAEYDIPLSEEDITDCLYGEIRRTYEEWVGLKPGAREALWYLRGLGLPMAVATATEHALAEAALGRLEVLDCFSGIFTCEMVGKGKTEPDVYLAAMRALGTAPGETLVFEDAPYAARTAYDAGFVVAAVHDEASAACGDMSFAHVCLADFKGLREFLTD